MKLGLAFGVDSDFEPMCRLEGHYEKSPKVSVERLQVNPSEPWDKIEKSLDGFDIVFLSPSLRMDLAPMVPARSVSSHFTAYADYLERRSGKWWSRSLFGQVCHKILLDVLQKRNFKGPVIFLGECSVGLPVLETVTKFGFSDICFLTMDEDSVVNNEKFLAATKSFINLNLSTVDSTAFIQSQTEYALCFISMPKYSKEVLEDMSYFHFLSSRSTVIDLSGGSNFQYSEVKALGVHLIESEIVSDGEFQSYLKVIEGYGA